MEAEQSNNTVLLPDVLLLSWRNHLLASAADFGEDAKRSLQDDRKETEPWRAVGSTSVKTDAVGIY